MVFQFFSSFLTFPLWTSLVCLGIDLEFKLLPHSLHSVLSSVLCEKARNRPSCLALHISRRFQVTCPLFFWFVNVFIVPIHIFWGHCLATFLTVHKFFFAFWYKTIYVCVVPSILLNDNIHIFLKFFFSFESGVLYWLWKILYDILNIG